MNDSQCYHLSESAKEIGKCLIKWLTNKLRGNNYREIQDASTSPLLEAFYT